MDKLNEKDVLSKELSIANKLSHEHPTKENLDAYNLAFDKWQEWLHNNSIDGNN